MPVIDISSDPEALTMTVTAEFTHPLERVWAAYTDPRQLERFWGPHGYPATFRTWDPTPGGLAQYHMTSPKGERYNGVWEFLSIEPPNRLEVLDLFAGDDGEPLPDMPSQRMVLTLKATDEGSRMVMTSHLDSLEALQQVIDMGQAEGVRDALGQIELVLTGLRATAQGRGTDVEILDDTHVRITRMVEGSREIVWRAYHDPDLLRQWMLGPDGWSMTECAPPGPVGSTYHWAWAPDPGTEGEPFGFEGKVLLTGQPGRESVTESMIGMDSPVTTNDTTLFEEDGATLITTLIEYPDAETRDMILGTGMADGMEASYSRLETLLAGL
ncbi:SRPBCC family protein [Galactobacter sp.]|uniref:SRPBCC family protein n=1 Tax=Galactobacter sp. TaxID=2676125 RepID=UPI0025BA2DF1|nr:SRPBCC family protein [Galactobacter sp.]